MNIIYASTLLNNLSKENTLYKCIKVFAFGDETEMGIVPQLVNASV